MHIVDIPGHERMRGVVRQYLPIASKLVYFIDSTEIETNLTANAEYANL